VKTPLILLLTSDPELEESVAGALVQTGGLSHLSHDPGDALNLVVDLGHDLDLAVIDCCSGPNGMTLLSAIHARRGHLPIIVVTRDDEQHVEALAYANGATCCLSKPIPPGRIAEVIRHCQQAGPEPALVT
jgi:DNA-binding response OmpR family regulator